MRVGIHAGQLLQPVPGGIGRYLRALLADLERAGADVLSFAAGRKPEGVSGGLPWVDLGAPSGGVRYEMWHRMRRLPVPVACDVLHAPNAAIPPAGDRPLVVTVHDVAFLRFPSVTTRRGRSFHKRSLDIARREAAAVIVPSAFTRAELIREGFDPSIVHVIPHGADAMPEPTREEIDWQLAGLDIEEPFVLTVGTIEPRKNIPALVAAMSAVRARHPGTALAIVGADGWGAVESISGPGVVRLVQLSNRALDALYRRAVVCCQPAIYEGFGLPALEAMTRGCPIVASAGGAMEEVVGDAGLLVTPDDPASISEAILRVVDDAGLRGDLVERGLARASQFSWTECAAEHLRVYQSVAGAAI